MPRRKQEDPDEEETETAEPGMALPPIEDFIRKMSERFAKEIVIDDAD